MRVAARHLGELAGARDLPELARRSLKAVEATAIPHSALSFDLLEAAAQRGRTIAASGVSDYFLTRYEQVGRRADPILQQALDTRRATDNRAVTPPSRWASVYENVFALHRLTNVLYAPILARGDVVATLDVGRGDADGPFSAEELQQMQALADVVGVAYGWLLRHDELAHERDHLCAAMDLCDEAVVITDASSGRRRLNVAARRLLAQLGPGAPGLDELLPGTGSEARTVMTETAVELADGTRARLRCRSAALERHPDVVVSFPRLLTTAAGLANVVQAGLTPRESDVVRLAVEGLRDTENAARMWTESEDFTGVTFA